MDTPDDSPDLAAPDLAGPDLAASRKNTGWSLAAQQRVLDHLRQLGGVAAAARAVGLSKQSAYALRRRSPGFAAAWDAAQDEGRDRAYQRAVERGLHGYTTPVRYRGRIVGQRHRHDNRLLYAACYGRPMPRPEPGT